MATSKHTPGPRAELPRHPGIVNLIRERDELLAALRRLWSISECQHWGACSEQAPDGINTTPRPMTEACPACEARALLARVDGGGQ